MRGNSYCSNLRCFCSCPFCFLLKGTAHLTGVTRLNGDEVGLNSQDRLWIAVLRSWNSIPPAAPVLGKVTTNRGVGAELRLLVPYIALVNVARACESILNKLLAFCCEIWFQIPNLATEWNLLVLECFNLFIVFHLVINSTTGHGNLWCALQILSVG